MIADADQHYQVQWVPIIVNGSQSNVPVFIYYNVIT